MTSPLHWVVPAGEAGARLDRFLASRMDGVSRATIQRLIREGAVRVGSRAAKPGLAVEAGAAIDVTVPAPSPAAPAPENLPLAVLHEDDDLVVIDKAAGMVVHPSAGHARGTLVNALLHHVHGLSGVGGSARPGIVHRLDRGTSGVMVVAKHDAAHQRLARQFHDREVEKEYVALVWGRPRVGVVMDQPIGRDPRHRQRMSGRAPRGRVALTRVTGVEAIGDVSLVRVTPGTGRTHQIRVHLSETGHPIVGDATYGGARRSLPPRLRALAALDRPFLHAARLSFTHPRTGARLSFEAPLPADLVAALAGVRRAAGAL